MGLNICRKKVEPMTLKAFAKEQVEKGKELRLIYLVSILQIKQN